MPYLTQGLGADAPYQELPLRTPYQRILGVFGLSSGGPNVGVISDAADAAIVASAQQKYTSEYEAAEMKLLATVAAVGVLGFLLLRKHKVPPQ